MTHDDHLTWASIPPTEHQPACAHFILLRHYGPAGAGLPGQAHFDSCAELEASPGRPVWGCHDVTTPMPSTMQARYGLRQAQQVPCPCIMQVRQGLCTCPRGRLRRSLDGVLRTGQAQHAAMRHQDVSQGQAKPPQPEAGGRWWAVGQPHACAERSARTAGWPLRFILPAPHSLRACMLMLVLVCRWNEKSPFTHPSTTPTSSTL